MSFWIIPLIYVVASTVLGLTVPRAEIALFSSSALGVSVSSAQASLSAATSGMMALTGVVFAMAFVMVQFNAIAYSPRLVLWFVRDRLLYHSLGVFSATFTYAFFTLAWVDRGGSGAVPMYSMLAVGALLIASMVFFALLVQRLGDLQITRVLQLIGGSGRKIIAGMFGQLGGHENVGDPEPRPANGQTMGPISQRLRYVGDPKVVVRFDTRALAELARGAEAFIVMDCAVGDTLIEGSDILRVHGPAAHAISEVDLLHAVRLDVERTFEQDPKYPIRLLVDIAIKALSPAVNDPTTAVQALDQIEDLLRRLGRCNLNAGLAADSAGVLRVVIPMPTWDDYLALAFDEIRQFGVTSLQVMRKLRATLSGLAETATVPSRANAVRLYLQHLDRTVEDSPLDAEDKTKALQEDRQGLGGPAPAAEP